MPVSVHADGVPTPEEVQPGIDHTSRSVAQNQVPRVNWIVILRGFKLLVESPKTDLKPLNNNLHHINHQFCRVMPVTHKVF